MNGSPTMISILPTVVYSRDHEPSLDAAPARLPKHFDEDDIELDLGLGEDRAEGANFGFSYQQVRSLPSTSRSDGSDTTLDQLRAQLEEPTFDESIKRPQTLVWFIDQSPTKHLNNNNARKHDWVFPKNLYGDDYLEDVLKVIREIEVDDLNFRDLFYRDSSFCRSSLANGSNYRTDEATGRGSLKHFNESTERSIQKILAILNLPDLVQVAAEDSSWEFCSEEMGTDILSLAEIAPAFSIANALQRGGPEDLFTWMAMDSDVDEDLKEELFSEDEDDQWHDAVLDLDAF
ncbi:hypothetical protein CPB84DRAFT_1769465 [Gymnopilus junonius]|uniref:Uncharacterized protein n=1 Tax=Gymnopilus junonius TaxID=109634 RepID=A0A9P5NUV2_GYMJU|nr:hypothetical protein CPB84DRAFT_1769465 [Gymnopilus junonius]